MNLGFLGTVHDLHLPQSIQTKKFPEIKIKYTKMISKLHTYIIQHQFQQNPLKQHESSKNIFHHQTLEQHNSSITQSFSKLKLPWNSACKDLSKACNSLTNGWNRKLTKSEVQWWCSCYFVVLARNRYSNSSPKLNDEVGLARDSLKWLQSHFAIDGALAKTVHEMAFQLVL